MNLSIHSKNTAGKPRVNQREAKLIRQEEEVDHREEHDILDSDFISLSMGIPVRYQNPLCIGSSDCLIFDTVKSLEEDALSIELQREQMITRL